ncbi:Phytochrome-like protein cph1 [Andreprevotia sp. IGB-42]|uniref:ATP-binding protein n=1 Tax=Andreprevotia sp. IGB-42 TaxID=2497473 RepID=UPI00157E7F52|nr:ATP-binding protein [Andreprevotia sp. IGB-42]KAF0812699.1 Phytochrome-like protein cph1 [Andreprevotia sp. IGB-42]
MSDDQTAVMSAAEAWCAQEPIRVPGSVQPHGFLLVIDDTELRIRQLSQSVQTWLGHAAEALLGTPLVALLGSDTPLAARLTGDYGEPHHLGVITLRHADGTLRPFEWVVHRQAQLLVLEFEPADGSSEQAFSGMYPLVRTFVNRIHEAVDVQTMCALAVSEVKRITGYGRVVAYRFDADGHGHVIAEEVDDGYDRYLGLHFPASDIPAQARALYVLNRIRVIQDADYTPSPLLPPVNPENGAPLDLSLAMLRSVSPVHLQYMKNMGTQASMSVSIVIDNALWGLISCHDHAPSPVRFHTRTACELLGNILSLQIEAKEAHEVATHMLSLRQQVVHMLSAMADRDSVHEGLLAMPGVLLGFARASGAAIVTASGIERVGVVPPLHSVAQLVAWLAANHAAEVFTSDCISRDLPHIDGLAEFAGGVLAVSISELHPHYLIWLRPETVRTVSWAGEPVKVQAESDGQLRLNPRASFASWQQTLRGFCIPWLPAEIDGALELRGAVLGIVLRKAEELAQLADELKKSNRELESFSYSVSHDLRAPLRHIASYAELLVDTEQQALTERGQHFLDNISESARFAGQLVDNLLTFSQMGRSEIRPTRVDVGELIATIQREMLPDYADRQIEWQIHPMPSVWADNTFLHLALRNLIANAIKYTRLREVAQIEIGAQQEGDEDVISIRDNGVGFDPQYASKLYGVFQRLHRMEEFEGTGIGLANVRRIVERHHGRTWAEGQPGAGATFHIALPRRITNNTKNNR